MLDAFFHKLIDANQKADDHKIGFLDCLLLLCATGFSLLTRWQLKDFTLAGYMGEEVSAQQLSYFNRIRLAEMPVAILIAVMLAGIIFVSCRSSRKASIAYTIVLFLPSLVALGGMAGYADSAITLLLFGVFVCACYRKYLSALAGMAVTLAAVWLLNSFLAPLCRSFSVFEIFGFGPFDAEYAKAGVLFVIFLIGCIIFVKGKTILASPRSLLVFAMLIGCICDLLLVRMPISVCLLIELLAIWDSFGNPKRLYRAILFVGIDFACIYRQMLDTTFIPAYIYSFLLLFLLLDLAWELYIMQEGRGTDAIRELCDMERDSYKVQQSGEKEREKDKDKEKWKSLVFMLFATLLGMAVRFFFRHFESVDYRFCFKPWTDAFKLGGGFRAMAGDFYNYPPFYMYMMYLVSLLPMEPLYPLKIVSILWDFFLAVGAGLCVRECTKSRKKGILTYALIWCLPTVAANSALWAQCDVMYVCLIIWSLYFYAKDKPKLSMLFYAGAFSFKMQVVFVLPVYLYLWVHRKYKLYQFLYLPGLYTLSCIPAWLIGGKSLKSLLLLYVGQSQQEPWMLSWYWPNIYQIFGTHEFYEFFAKAGMYGAIAVTMLLLYDMARKLKSTNPKMIMMMMYAFSVVIPFFLPYMHERYGYLADVLAVMLFVSIPRFLPLAVSQVLISYVAYASHLHEEVIVPTYLYCIPMAIMVWTSVRAVYSFAQREEK